MLQAKTDGQGGLILTADARAAGYDARAIARELSTGRWHHLRRGAYVPTRLWSAAVPESRQLITARAVQLQAEHQVALTHTTGAVALGVDMFRPGLETVHVTHLRQRSSRVEYGVTHHNGPLDPSSCLRVDGMLVGPPARVVAGVSSTASASTCEAFDPAMTRARSCGARRCARTGSGHWGGPWSG